MSQLCLHDVVYCYQAVLSVCLEGANVYAKSRSGTTALTEAAANGHTEIVNILNRHLMSAKSHLGMTLSRPLLCRRESSLLCCNRNFVNVYTQFSVICYNQLCCRRSQMTELKITHIFLIS